MRFFVLAAAAAVLLSAPSAWAGDEVPLANFGSGYFDPFDNLEQDSAADFRFEYRFGQPLAYVIKPQIALEATSDGGAGAFAGVVADWVIADHWVVAPSFSVGAWASGGGKEMGSVLQFRSQIEAGYRFDGGTRLVGALSHMSNGDIVDKNPGAEVAAVYLQIPADALLPR